MLRIVFSFLLFMTVTKVHANNLYLLVGGGSNISYYESKGTPTLLGAGLNFQTDIGYSFSKNWSVELGSLVKFNRAGHYNIWDTFLNMGVRHIFENRYYVRGFLGRATSVFYLNQAPEVIRDTNSSRVQLEGPAFGFSVGKALKTEAGRDWFVEGTVLYQIMEDIVGIRNDGEVPRETFKSKADENLNIISVIATVGVRLF